MRELPRIAPCPDEPTILVPSRTFQRITRQNSVWKEKNGVNVHPSEKALQPYLSLLN